NTLANECRDEARTKLIEAGYTQAQFADLWEDHSDDYFVRTRPEDVVWHTRCVIEHGEKPLPLVSVRTAGRGTEVFLFDQNRDYHFAATTAILERLGVTVMDARLFTDTANGRAFDSYTVLEANGERIADAGREAEIQRTLVRRLAEPEKAVYPSKRLPRRQLGVFPVPPRVSFDLDAEYNRTVLEVMSADRPGLLSRVGWALVGCNAVVQSAKIATFGERAEDVFFVTNADGGPLGELQSETLRSNILRALEPPKKRS
ncbi:MAG: [protein-PII] uridylyltransferase, partial [Gammaproteobacteria bacterium]